MSIDVPTPTGPGRLLVTAGGVDSVRDGPPPQPTGPVDDSDMMTARYQTPLRYPGAKSSLSRRLVDVFDRLDGVDLLVEPFVGGGSMSLRLVGAGVVDRVLLADADPLVATFWQQAAARPDELVAAMHDEYGRWFADGRDPARAVRRWDRWRTTTTTGPLETALKCLVLNRTTFSGILHGRAGPLGGRSQDSSHGINCRFNPQRLARQIRWVGQLYATGRIADVRCGDWHDTCTTGVDTVGADPDRTVLYLDPPYVEKSAALYRTSFDTDGGPGDDAADAHTVHFRLATFLRRSTTLPWVLSYDDEPRLLTDRGLYAVPRTFPADGTPGVTIQRLRVPVRHTISSGSSSSKEELLLTTLPTAAVGGLGTPV